MINRVSAPSGGAEKKIRSHLHQKGQLGALLLRGNQIYSNFQQLNMAVSQFLSSRLFGSPVSLGGYFLFMAFHK